MTLEHVLELFRQYGWLMMAAVFFCEYLNLPGFPAGVIMPAVGILVGQSEQSLMIAIVVSVLAGLAGSLVMYLICFYGGAPLLHRFFGKHPKFQGFVDQCHSWIDKHKGRGLMVCRLIPVLRTIVSIPAGLLRMPLGEYALWSAAGITMWNTTLITFGYLFSEMLMK